MSKYSKKIEKEASRLASLATDNNPIRLMLTGDLLDEAMRLAKNGTPEVLAVAQLKDFIIELNKKP